MKRNTLFPYFFAVVLFPSFFVFATGCKKDQLTVNETRVYVEVRDKAAANNPYGGGWRLTLNPDGDSEVLPGGDIMYGGKFSIRGSTIKVSTEDIGSFDFQIISENEIKEKKYGAILKLNQ